MTLRMKNKRIFLAGFLLAGAFALKGETNRALFVAISDYPEESGWMKIHAVNDYDLVAPMLKKNGYKDENITVLFNQQATKEAIVGSLNELSLQTQKGDRIYLHFSCHGQQMTDKNGDEPDCLDEALIPYDAQRRYKKGKYEGKKHLRDDELEALLNNIRSAAGKTGNLIVVIDACHSATATRERNDDYIRGTTYVFGEDEHKDDLPSCSSGNFKLSLKTSDKLSPVSVFSACQADQSNCEYKADSQSTYYGSLSYAFCRIAGKANGKLSNRAFAQKIEEEIHDMFKDRRRKQTPYFESTDEEKVFILGK